MWGAGFAVFGILGLGGLESNILNWLGWLKINPYLTGAALGVTGLCGLLYIKSQWGKQIVRLWNRLLIKIRGLDRHAMAILRKEETRLEALRLEIAEYRESDNPDSARPVRIVLDLMAVQDLLNILGVPTPSVFERGRDLDDVLIDWAMFIPLLLVRIRHGDVNDVRAILDDWDYDPSVRKDDRPKLR